MNTPRILRVGEELPAMDGPPMPRPAQRDKPKGKPIDRRRTGDRFNTINTFLDASMAGLRPCERAVWLLLWRDTKRDGLARTSQADLARRAGASIRAVHVAVRELSLRGLLIVVHRGGLSAGPSSYRVVAMACCD